MNGKKLREFVGPQVKGFGQEQMVNLFNFTQKRKKFCFFKYHISEPAEPNMECGVSLERYLYHLSRSSQSQSFQVYLSNNFLDLKIQIEIAKDTSFFPTILCYRLVAHCNRFQFRIVGINTSTKHLFDIFIKKLYMADFPLCSPFRAFCTISRRSKRKIRLYFQVENSTKLKKKIVSHYVTLKIDKNPVFRSCM